MHNWYLKMNQQIRVGVIGYSSKKFDMDEALDDVKNAFDLIEIKYKGKEIIIISGLTNIGIPGIAYEEAKIRNWKTIGIAPKEAQEYECFDVNKTYFVGDKFGDESEFFINYIDILLKIGGGEQSKKEKKMAEGKHIPILEYNLELTDI